MSDVALPKFSALNVANFPDELDALLQKNLTQITNLLEQNAHYTWDNLFMPLEDMDDELERFWSPLSHLHAVVDSKSLREVYEICLPKLSAYHAAIGHNEALYHAIKSLDPADLNATQNKIRQDALRDFELSGVALPLDQKQRFEAIQTRLSALSNQFENHILDSVHAYELYIDDETRLEGLPEHALYQARERAKEKDKTGWILTLDVPCYLAVMMYAEDRALREEMYMAFVTRASDEGPNAGEFDNSAIMDEILALRFEKAQLLGFDNYAQLSIATKMADSCKEVMQFLTRLANQSYPQGKEEFAQLERFAQNEYQWSALKPWDVAFLSEKKRQHLHAISQEALRPYFPLPQVMKGLFSIIHKLYGMHMEALTGVDVWHPDVTCYQIKDKEHVVRGYLYLDLFARPHKRGGAWMDSLQSRRKKSNGQIQVPIATLTCNFAKPAGGKVPTLSHDEVLTLFHEMGHCLHHVLTQVDYVSASGVNGVEWDAVELPSQFFENWCWEKEALAMLTAHVETGETLPSHWFEKLIAAKNFQSAMAMLRQLEFSLFDFRIHQEYAPENKDVITSVLKDVRDEYSVVPIVPYNRFQHSFSHIFAGGYAAGYYSYKWAEVLSSDAFSRFEEEGIFNEQTGSDFLHSILEVGGSCPAAEAFVAFRKRPAQIDALLRHNGINTDADKE